MALSNYDIDILNFNKLYSYYEDNFEHYTEDSYSKKIDDDFHQIKDPMGEIVEQIRIALLLSHICEPTLNHEQIRNGRKVIKKFEEIHDRHREMLAISSQLKLKSNIEAVQVTVKQVTELEKKVVLSIKNTQTIREKILETIKDVNDIKGNLFGIFSFMVGFLGFIFINFNVFSKLGDLSVNKVITVVLFLNTSFISGVVILMKLFKDMLFYKKSDEKDNYLWIRFLIIYGVINLFLIILLSFIPTIKLWIFSFFI